MSSELLDCDPIVIFCYEPTRGTDHLRRFFVHDVASLSDEQLREMPETKALMLIRDIYHEENKLNDMSADDRPRISKCYDTVVRGKYRI